MLNSLTRLRRMCVVACAPQSYRLVTRLDDGTVVTGLNRRGHGGRGIFIDRETIEPEFRLLSSFLGKGDVLIDVGANTGIYTLRGGRLVGPQGVVLSLEPNPEMIRELAYNVEVNRLANVRIRGLAAGSRTGEAKFWANYGLPNSYGLVRHDSQSQGFSVLQISLDDLVSWEGLDRCDYIKIDAEGSEQDILAGARQLVARHRPVVQMEVSVATPNVEFDDYSAFVAVDQAGRRSQNTVWIPCESSRIDVARRLGLLEATVNV